MRTYTTLLLLALLLPALLAQSPPGTANLPIGPTSAPATATAPQKPRPYTSMADILIHTPEDLRPQNKPDWYKFTQGKFQDWWAQQLPGMTFDQTLPLDFTVGRALNNTPGHEWQLSGSFPRKTFTYFAREHSLSLRFPNLTFDEATAKKWSATKSPALFKVTGTISSATFDPTTINNPNTFPSYHLILSLHDLKLSPPN